MSVAHGISSAGALRPAREDPLAARRRAGALRVERTADVHVVEHGQAVHVLQVEIARMQLERLVRLGLALRDERDRHVVRPGRNEHARPQALVDRVRGRRHVRVGHRVVFLAADGREEHALAVDRDLDVVRPLEARHVADDVAHEEHVEGVLAVEREVVMDQDAAARAERQSLDVLRLGEIRRRAVDRRDRVRVGVADRERRDFRRGGQVLLEQRRRHAQDVRDVVEAVALVVGRQKLGGVDVEREQLAHRVAVFGAVQTADRGVAGVRMLPRGRVETLLEVRDEAVVGLLVGMRLAGRGHHAAAELTRDLLPDLGVRDRCPSSRHARARGPPPRPRSHGNRDSSAEPRRKTAPPADRASGRRPRRAARRP